MVLFIILIISEFLTFLVFRQHYKGFSRTKYYLSSVINAIFSAYMWILYVEVSSFKGDFDDPGHIWLRMALTGTFCSILFPRVLLNLLHFTGKALRYRSRGHIRSLTNTGIIIWIIIFTAIISGTLRGRFNFSFEEVTIESEKLNKLQKELVIVQISDLHLAGFDRHKPELASVMEKINSYKPDFIFNTGDFVSYGWKEFDRNDTILAIAGARLGKFAILGNHDAGTYHPDYNVADRDTNIKRLTELIEFSGYTLLADTAIVIEDAGLKIALGGITTRGKRLNITYGDLAKASAGTDSADYSILLSHDPNHWEKEVEGKARFDLTLSGHTHGMQIGILTKNFSFSPSLFFFRHWHGMYTSGNQNLYVNRGLGVLAIPFRIGMPPEITIIRLKGKNLPAGSSL
jgi:hypothetical protein